jgi:hypothetical protein
MHGGVAPAVPTWILVQAKDAGLFQSLDEPHPLALAFLNHFPSHLAGDDKFLRKAA